MVSLDSVFPGGSPPVSVLKVDVEGFEVEVLQGARHLIERDRPALILEVNDPARVEAHLGELGYSCYAYDPATTTLDPTAPKDHLHRNVIALFDVGAARARVGARTGVADRAVR